MYKHCHNYMSNRNLIIIANDIHYYSHYQPLVYVCTYIALSKGNVARVMNDIVSAIVCILARAYKEKRACNSPRAKTLWAEECYWKSTVISKNRFLLNRVLQSTGYK